MDTKQAFKWALGIEMLCWFTVNDLRIVIIYGLIVFFALRTLYVARKTGI
jgi:hypothetical protein